MMVANLVIASVLVAGVASKLDESSGRVVELTIGTTITFLECGIQRETPPETADQYMIQSNGLEAVSFDTNQDGHEDARLLIPKGDINRHPLFYSFDIDHDNYPDITYIDKARDGTCSQIEVYWAKEPKPEDKES